MRPPTRSVGGLAAALRRARQEGTRQMLQQASGAEVHHKPRVGHRREGTAAPGGLLHRTVGDLCSPGVVGHGKHRCSGKGAHGVQSLPRTNDRLHPGNKGR